MGMSCVLLPLLLSSLVLLLFLPLSSSFLDSLLCPCSSCSSSLPFCQPRCGSSCGSSTQPLPPSPSFSYSSQQLPPLLPSPQIYQYSLPQVAPLSQPALSPIPPIPPQNTPYSYQMMQNQGSSQGSLESSYSSGPSDLSQYQPQQSQFSSQAASYQSQPSQSSQDYSSQSSQSLSQPTQSQYSSQSSQSLSQPTLTQYPSQASQSSSDYSQQSQRAEALQPAQSSSYTPSQPRPSQYSVSPSSQAATPHPTLVQPSPYLGPNQQQRSMPKEDLKDEFDILSRGEGKSTKVSKSSYTPFTAEYEEDLESYDRQPASREALDDLDDGISENVIYDDEFPMKENDEILAHNRGDVTLSVEQLDDKDGELDMTSMLANGLKWMKWAKQGKRARKHDDTHSSMPKHKCNSEQLRNIMEEKMVGSPSASKQLVYSAVLAAFGRSPDVICSRSSFSYIVVSSPIFCEHHKTPSTCFVYFQP